MVSPVALESSVPVDALLDPFTFRLIRIQPHCLPIQKKVCLTTDSQIRFLRMSVRPAPFN
jgi:hypothetical protein